MNRAVIVLLLLIANAIVADRRSHRVDPAPSADSANPPALFRTVDGAPAGTPRCGVQDAPDRPSTNISLQAAATRLGRRSAPSLPTRPDDNARVANMLDVPL